MDIVQMARELGKAVAKEDRIVRYNVARQTADEDKELQEMIGQFNLKKMEINNRVNKADKTPEDEQRLATLNTELREFYGKVMSHPAMIAYNSAKQEVDQFMDYITRILSAGVNGEDPDTVEEQAACSGSCASCPGCH